MDTGKSGNALIVQWLGHETFVLETEVRLLLRAVMGKDANMRFLKGILWLFIALLATPIAAENCPAVQIRVRDWHGLESELPTIITAAERNHCQNKLFSILLAIRKTENGPRGFEFGVIAAQGTNLDKQAGWAAATVVKSYARWQATGNIEGGIPNFINFLADRYCPIAVDPEGNKNWKINVPYWFNKFEN